MRTRDYAAEYQADKLRNGGRTASNAPYNLAKQRAMRRLTKLHPCDFKALLAEELEKAREQA